jgi:hypothetical protein
VSARPSARQDQPCRAGRLSWLGLAWLGLVVACGVLLAPIRAWAQTPDELFRLGTNALGEGKYDEAIDDFEALADQGAQHPDASYNRGLGYVMRVRANAARPGDLGRAAAAFEEALLLRPGDRDAEHALELVQAEVARRGARRGKDVLTERPPLDRLLVGLASERVWAISAAVVALLLAAGLVLRSRKSRPWQIAGRVLSPVAFVALVGLLPLYLGARRVRLNSQPAIVVAPEVFLADERGVSLGGDPVPEAAKVEAGEKRGRLVHVRSGTREGWVPVGSIYVLRYSR